MAMLLGSSFLISLLIGTCLIAASNLFKEGGLIDQLMKGAAAVLMMGSIPSGLIGLVFADQFGGAVKSYAIACCCFAAIGALYGATSRSL